MKSIGILGGTFNPPHNGHLKAAEKAREQLGLDKILFIPSNLPPHKEITTGSPTPLQRLEMIKLAVSGLPFAFVDSREIDRGGVSYTVETVEALKNDYPGVTLWLIIGSDMLFSIESWREAERLLSMISVACLQRHSGECAKIDKMAEYLRKKYGAEIQRIKNIKPFDISSTGLRGEQNPRVLSAGIPKYVLEYIKSNGLYNTDSIK